MRPPSRGGHGGHGARVYCWKSRSRPVKSGRLHRLQRGEAFGIMAIGNEQEKESEEQTVGLGRRHMVADNLGRVRAGMVPIRAKPRGFERLPFRRPLGPVFG